MRLLEKEAKTNEEENNKIRKLLLENSEITANKLYSSYRKWTMALIAFAILLVILLGYTLKGDNDSDLSVVAYIISAISLLVGVISWSAIDKYLRNKAFKNHQAVKQNLAKVVSNGK